MTYIQEFRTMLVREDTKIPQFKIEGPVSAVQLMIDEYHLDCLPTEEIWAVYTNVKGYVVGVQQISRGGLSSTICDPRSVFTPAIHCNAASVVLFHNHPSGDPSPSPEDQDLTNRIAECGKILNIALLDHIVIGGKNQWYSFMEHDCLYKKGEKR